MKKIIYSSLLLTTLSLVSCDKDFVKTDQNGSFSDERIDALVRFPEQAITFNSHVEAGTISNLSKTNFALGGNQHEDFGLKATDLGLDMMAQDIVVKSTNWFSFHYIYQMRLESQRTRLLYNFYVKTIADTNLIVQFVTNRDANYTTNPIYARALALRGFMNFYLVRLYAHNGLGTSYQIYDIPSKSFVNHFARVEEQEQIKMIETDLITAYDILKDAPARANKMHMDKQVVAGLLTRFYLFTKEFDKAKQFAYESIEGSLESNSWDLLSDGFNNLNNAEMLWGDLYRCF